LIGAFGGKISWREDQRRLEVCPGRIGRVESRGHPDLFVPRPFLRPPTFFLSDDMITGGTDFKQFGKRIKTLLKSRFVHWIHTIP